LDLSPAPSLKPRVALLIDGDNFPRSGLSDVESRAARLGDVTIRRVFGDMSLRKDWAQETAYTATHCASLSGKHRADMALVIAAMDLVHRGLAASFVIASDDQDFDPLVSYLREQGYSAERLGKQKAQPADTERSAAKAKPTSRSDKVVRKVRALILTTGAAGYPIQLLGVALHEQGVNVADTPHKTWRSWLLSHPDEFECDARGPTARVRLKAQAETP
jgi:NYN domain